MVCVGVDVNGWYRKLNLLRVNIFVVRIFFVVVFLGIKWMLKKICFVVIVVLSFFVKLWIGCLLILFLLFKENCIDVYSGEIVILIERVKLDY